MTTKRQEMTEHQIGVAAALFSNLLNENRQQLDHGAVSKALYHTNLIDELCEVFKARVKNEVG